MVYCNQQKCHNSDRQPTGAKETCLQQHRQRCKTHNHCWNDSHSQHQEYSKHSENINQKSTAKIVL